MDRSSPKKRINMDEENTEIRRKKRRVVRMAKPSESLDPTEKLTEDLSNYMGIARNRTFNELNTKGKEGAGSRLQSLLSDVSDSALTPLMHFTLNAGHVKKLANIKQILGSIIKDHCGISEERSFTYMSEVEKNEVGGHLSGLLKQVSGDALVPLLNYTLNTQEVQKLASLKGVLGREHDSLEIDATSAANDVKKEEPEDDMDVDDLMAAANSDIPHWKHGQTQPTSDERNADAAKSECNTTSYLTDHNIDNQGMAIDDKPIKSETSMAVKVCQTKKQKMSTNDEKESKTNDNERDHERRDNEENKSNVMEGLEKSWYDGCEFYCPAENCGKVLGSHELLREHWSLAHRQIVRSLGHNFFNKVIRQYECRKCSRKIQWNRKAICDHVNKKHGITFGNYEAEFHSDVTMA